MTPLALAALGLALAAIAAWANVLGRLHKARADAELERLAAESRGYARGYDDGRAEGRVRLHLVRHWKGEAS